jgi:hypothetical protein
MDVSALIGKPIRWHFGPIIGHITDAVFVPRKGVKLSFQVDPKYKAALEADCRHFSVAREGEPEYVDHDSPT